MAAFHYVHRKRSTGDVCNDNRAMGDSLATARWGPEILWICTVSVLLQALLNTEMARYTLATGEPIFAGFMRVVSNVLLDAFPMRVLNIHPALLPAFPGLNAQSQAFAHGVKMSGCTVHFVDAGTDTGPIIAQAVVPILNQDDDESLRQRILNAEHRLLPTVLQWLAEGRVTAKPGPKGNERARVVLEGVEGAFVYDLPMNELEQF